MIRKRLLTIGSLAALVSAVPGCGSTATEPQAQGEVDPVFGMALNGLGEVVNHCNNGSDVSTVDNFDESSKTVSMTLQGGSTVFSVVGTALTVNGWSCYDNLGVALTTSNVRKLNLTTAGTGEKVVFDLLPGSFGSIFSASGGVTVDMQSASDSFALRGSAANNTITVGEYDENADTIGDYIYIEASGDTKADIQLKTNLPGNATDELIFVLGEGNDTFRAAGGNISATHIDSNVTSLIPVNSGRWVTVYGGDDDDTIQGGNGDDILYGGNGDDTFEGDSADDGSDTFNGGAGTDTVSYADRSNAVTVDINPGVVGTSGSVNLYDLTAITYNGSGTNTFTVDCDGTGSGDIVMDATDASAVLAKFPAAECDAYIDSMGRLVIYDTTTADNPLDLGEGSSAGGLATLGFVAGTYDGADADDGESGEGDEVAADVENIVGGSGDDNLMGSDMSNTISGGAGADYISGGIANADCSLDVDVLNGDDDDDTFMMGTVKDCGDEVNGGNGTDLADYQFRSANLTLSIGGTGDDGDQSGTAETDTLKTDVEKIFGGSGDDTITGGNGDEDLRGGPGADTITGGGGADTLVGHGGDDELNGGNGDDLILCSGNDTDYVSLATAAQDRGAGADVMNGGAGTDKVDYSGRTAALTIQMCTDVNTSGAPASADAECVSDDGEAGENDGVINMEWLSSGSGDDTLQGHTAGETIEGGAGADTISGGAGADTLFGDDGNDTVDGEAGDDLVNGGAGDDTLIGGDGDGDICNYVPAEDVTNTPAGCEVQ